jgi:hypothetical protein
MAECAGMSLDDRDRLRPLTDVGGTAPRRRALVLDRVR